MYKIVPAENLRRDVIISIWYYFYIRYVREITWKYQTRKTRITAKCWFESRAEQYTRMWRTKKIYIIHLQTCFMVKKNVKDFCENNALMK